MKLVDYRCSICGMSEAELPPTDEKVERYCPICGCEREYYKVFPAVAAIMRKDGTRGKK